MNQVHRQFCITPAAGKRLIGKAVAQSEVLKLALESKTVVIIAGTTNGYVAEEVLLTLNQIDGFNRERFFRGVTLPPSVPVTEAGRITDESQFPGDVVIRNGQWIKGQTIFDVVDELGKGDLIIKGANAVSLRDKQAAIYIGHPTAGTIGVSLPAVVGRRVQLMIPVGLEKRVDGNLDEMARNINQPGTNGPRMLPVTGQVITELDAIEQLFSVNARLVAGGGVSGAEGSCWIMISGDGPAVERASDMVGKVKSEMNFSLV